MIAHVAYPDRRVLERAVPRADRPSLLLERADDVLGMFSFRQPQAGDGPAVPALAREEFHAVLRAPGLDPAPHGVLPFPARLDAAFALHPRQLHFACIAQRDVGRAP